MRLLCFILGHRWDWYPKIGFYTGQRFHSPETNAYCRRCGEETWAHGRGPFRS